MSLIAGVDLGSNSIGWAIRDTAARDNQIVDYGVLTFEKGVASEKGNEFPKVQKRTESRGKRRNYQAEKYRKWALLEFLISKDMCPLSLDELNQWRHYTKGSKRQYPQSDAFVQWLRFDFNGDGLPDFHLFGRDQHESYYIFRALALDENYRHVYQNNPQILGRIFYQLVQRRGFRGRDEEEAKTMLEGSEKSATPGRDTIAGYINEHITLGAALYHYQRENGGRIRRRYNLRKDYEEELQKLCEYHQIEDSDYQKLWKAIIWQRPLRSQKGQIGICIYEQKTIERQGKTISIGKPRCAISHPLYEEYRTWVFINNLKIIPPAGTDKATYLQNNIYPLFYKAGNDFDFKTILGQLKKDGAGIESKFGEKTKVLSAKLLKHFQDLLGPDWKETYGWHLMHERYAQPLKKSKAGYTFEDIWHVLNTFDGQENLKAFALQKLKLNEEKAAKFSKIKLNQGYATLSLSAIKKILPFLQRGIPYSLAVYLANIPRILGEKHSSDDIVSTLATDIEQLISANKEEKQYNAVVNRLIQGHINDEFRYTMESDRPLDEEELNLIHARILEELGSESWQEKDEATKSYIVGYVSDRYKDFLKKPARSQASAFVAMPRLHDQIFGLIQARYTISDDQKKYLWHPSEQDSYIPAEEYNHYSINGRDVYIPERSSEGFQRRYAHAQFESRSLRLLGSPQPLSKGFKNPMALKSLYRLRHLLNDLLQSGKIDEDTRIVIEIARELNDANKRKAIERWNRDREKENEKYKEEIKRYNTEKKAAFNENDRTLLRKIRLWHEQGMQCLYTGATIRISDILNGVNFDIEHTIPASISFDNELKNLTLADVHFNRNVKGKLFPAQLTNYEDIEPRIEFMRTKIEALKLDYKDWKNKASYASTKEIKDNCIQRYHMIKMDLDYWRAKYDTFTIKEYKAGWKNSQLRDTQIITKFALPYLKTVFRKVSVEKAEVVRAFKEIYEVKLADEKKDRSLHSHHAIDAAILTLIPPFYDRDKILLKYNEEKDRRTGRTYHEKPKEWRDFVPSKILSIREDILINNLSENRTTLPTYKVVRKRGRIVWKDKENNLKKIAQGDTIRGQLHGESLYGAIKLPKRDEQNKILFDDNGKMIVEDDPILVIRKELVYKKDANSPGFKSLEEIDRVIVDRDLFAMIKKQVEEAPDFKTALNEGVYMIDGNGRRVNRIRRIRCKEAMKYSTAVRVHNHAYTSDKEYKRHTLAKNGENALCLFYKNGNSRAMTILSIGQVASLKFGSDHQYYEEPYYNQLETGKGKSKSTLPLYAILRVGIKVLFYKTSDEELKDLSKEDLSRRLFKIYQFESDGRIKFRHHLAAGIDTELKKQHQEYSHVNLDEDQVFLRLRQGQWNFIIEGKDFDMKLDGSIEFKY